MKNLHIGQTVTVRFPAELRESMKDQNGEDCPEVVTGEISDIGIDEYSTIGERCIYVNSGNEIWECSEEWIELH
jgi:hypothetical protein